MRTEKEIKEKIQALMKENIIDMMQNIQERNLPITRKTVETHGMIQGLYWVLDTEKEIKNMLKRKPKKNQKKR